MCTQVTEDTDRIAYFLHFFKKLSLYFKVLVFHTFPVANKTPKTVP